MKAILYIAAQMKKEAEPRAFYQEQLQRQKIILAGFQQRRRQIGWLRFVVFVLTIVLAYIVFTQIGLAGFLPTIAGIGVLLYLVSKDVANNEQIRNAKTLIRINEEEIR